MICLMNYMGQLYSPKLTLKVDITKFESRRVMSGKPLLRPNLDYMSGWCTALVVGSDDVASSYSIGVLTRRQVGRRERCRGAREVASY